MERKSTPPARCWIIFYFGGNRGEYSTHSNLWHDINAAAFLFCYAADNNPHKLYRAAAPVCRLQLHRRVDLRVCRCRVNRTLSAWQKCPKRLYTAYSEYPGGYASRWEYPAKIKRDNPRRRRCYPILSPCNMKFAYAFRSSSMKQTNSW
jgi:hypothetical protein